MGRKFRYCFYNKFMRTVYLRLYFKFVSYLSIYSNVRFSLPFPTYEIVQTNCSNGIVAVKD